MGKKILNYPDDSIAITAMMTELHKSKKQYKKIIDAIQDSIFVVNKNLEILSYNAVFAKNVNIPIKEIKGLVCRNVVPGFRENLFANHCSLAEQNESCYAKKIFLEKQPAHFVQQYTDKSGKIHYYKFNLFPIEDDAGSVYQVVVVIKDVTKTKTAEHEVSKLNKDLEKKVERRTNQLNKLNKELNKVLDINTEFISDASHELRTPLTIIQGNVDLEIQGLKNKNKKIPEFYEIIQKELSRMTDILNDLTNLTNADAETEKIEKEIVSLNIVTKSAVRSLDVLARQKDIKLYIAKSNPNINIIGDELKLEKMLLNVIRNAIKYTNVGGRIRVHLEEKDKIAKIIIEDNGIGIPEKDLPYIFERFYRVDKARSRQEGGTGLGLSICKWIAEAHGGSIKVESTEGKGSKFTLELPINI